MRYCLSGEGLDAVCGGRENGKTVGYSTFVGAHTTAGRLSPLPICTAVSHSQPVPGAGTLADLLI